MKQYELGMVCGRFSHIHKGHQLLIDKSLKLCKKTLILVGSSQESHTLRNPFEVDFRIKLIKKVYPNNECIIVKLEDMTNEYDISFEWGQYVIDHVKEHTGRFADLIITGNDDLRKGWFSEEQMENTEELVIDRKMLDISATNLRGYIMISDIENWKKYTPQAIHNDFNEIREKLLEVDIYKEIMEKIQDNLTFENYIKVYKEYERIDREKKMNQ